jgi:hypothetical protein
VLSSSASGSVANRPSPSSAAILRRPEEFQWFVRAHLESADGTLSTVGASTEGAAAKRATRKTKTR